MRRAIFASIVFATVIMASVAFSSPSTSVLLHAPRISDGLSRGQALNWAGYAVETSLSSPLNGAVTDVKGSWTVPAVNCASSPNSYSSFWIGIDGYSSGTVEQIGTDSDCNSKKAVYYAWYEMYPAYPVNLNIKVSPGDTINAEVQYVGNNQFKLTLTNKKTSYSTTQTLSGAARSSAEWIAEAPSVGGSITNLANFGRVYFTGCQVTLNGHTGPINDNAWQSDAITMVTRNGIVKAQPSSVSKDGSAFSVTWYHK